ncbi:dihydrodipicolinate synthase family protein [Desulfofalx alkaliphila]|uniref:dihydrodipicolinate synthase family protein n=1 Tax=Desulfofalx alkaliphila TaxID=105483 RepID=UPI0004E2459F|nr:dihydrodipicolinate synthase family protein [Desulfofalx alkaliphila]
MKKVKFKGIIPPMVTIFNEDGSFDWEGNKAVIDYLINGGVHGIFVMGSSSEFNHLTSAERKEFAEFAVDYVNGRVPVLVGTGHTNTQTVVDLSRHAQSIGADGVVVVTPYYWKLSEENLFNHFTTVAGAIDLPVVLYHYPNLTGQQFDAPLVARIVKEMPNVVGIKDTIDSISHIRELIITVKEINPDFSVFSAYDDHLFNTLVMGGDGAISGSSNFAPEINVGVYQNFVEGNYQKAIDINNILMRLTRIYGFDTPAIGVMKEGLRLRGVPIKTHVRPPAAAASPKAVAALESLLKSLQLI